MEKVTFTIAHKLDGLGLVDNRPSTDKTGHKKYIYIHDM